MQGFKVSLFLNECWHNGIERLNTIFIAIYPFQDLHTGCIKSIQCNCIIYTAYMKTVSQNTFQSIWNKSQKNTYHGTNVVIQLTYI